MLNLLIISGALVGCASTESEFSATSFDEPESTVENLQQPTTVSFTVTVKDGTEGHIDVVPYTIGEQGITTGKTLSSGEIVDGEAEIGLPANAPRRDLAGIPADVSPTYALIVRGEEGNIVGIADARLIFSRFRTAERAMGWNLAFDLYEESEYFMSVHSDISVTANLTGNEELAFQVVSEVESDEAQHFSVVASTDQLYTLWDAHMGPGTQVSMVGEPAPFVFGEGIDGIHASQSIGMIYRDANEDGKFDMEDPIDGVACWDGNAVNLTYISAIGEAADAIQLENLGLKTGWSVTVNGSGGTEVIPDGADNYLEVQGDCSFPH